jgi:hypothetical protein
MVRALSLAALALLVLALALTLANGRSHSIAKRIAASAADQYKATDAACTTDGMVLFPRASGPSKIYDCLISGGDPDLLYDEHIRSSPFRRCYAYSGGPVDVTGYLHELLSRGQLRATSPERFPCVNLRST